MVRSCLYCDVSCSKVASSNLQTFRTEWGVVRIEYPSIAWNKCNCSSHDESHLLCFLWKGDVCRHMMLALINARCEETPKSFSLPRFSSKRINGFLSLTSHERWHDSWLLVTVRNYQGRGTATFKHLETHRDKCTAMAAWDRHLLSQHTDFFQLLAGSDSVVHLLRTSFRLVMQRLIVWIARFSVAPAPCQSWSGGSSTTYRL
jgi:hypothetical protein